MDDKIEKLSFQNLILTRDNIREYLSQVLCAIEQCTFVALDTEFSGLGDIRALSDKNVDIRYMQYVHFVKNRALFQIGLSIWRKINQSETEKSHIPQSGCPIKYEVENYTLMLHRSDDYTVSPKSLTFLCKHGFDFNLLYTKGIPFIPRPLFVPSKQSEESHDLETILYEFFSCLISYKKPLVIHCGILDLMLLYYSFINDFPETLHEFIEQLRADFPLIYDTKYIAIFHQKEEKHYLEYLFRYCELANKEDQLKGRPYIVYKITVPSSEFNSLRISSLSQRETNSKLDSKEKELCPSFAVYGFCKEGLECEKSHDVQLVLEKDKSDVDFEANLRRNQKRKRENFEQISDAIISTKKTNNTDINKTTQTESSHQIHSKNMDINDSYEEGEITSQNAQSHFQLLTLKKSIHHNKEENFDQSKKQISENAISKEINNQNLSHLPNQQQQTQSIQQDFVIGKELKHVQPMHTAGQDAFGTGFTFAYMMQKFNIILNDADNLFVNRLYLVGRDLPPLRLHPKSTLP